MASSFPQNHNLQQFLHQNTSQQQSQQSTLFRDFYEGNKMDGRQVSSQHQVTTYFNINNNPNVLDHHPPYIPPLSGSALGRGPVTEEDNGLDLQWIESKKKRPIEQFFPENNLTLNGNIRKTNNKNSQLSELLQARSVSTGLGLSLENNRLASSGDSGLAGLIGDSLEQELQRQDAEIDRYLKIQGDHLRQAISEKFHGNQLQIISYLEEKTAQKLREKEAELEDTNKKNLELELRLERLTMEAKSWEQRAKYNESMINTLKHNLQQVYAQSGRGSIEGCGDSEVDDTASCCNGRPTDFRGNAATKESMTCKVCRVNKVCMIMLPCKHLCLCKDCESKLSFCPLCHSSKYIGMEVYM